MRFGPALGMAVLILVACAVRVRAQTSVDSPIAASVVLQTTDPQTASDPAAEQFRLESLPDKTRRNLSIYVSAFVGITAFGVLLQRRLDWQKLDPVHNCRHCLKVHKTAGLIAIIGDATTTSALLILGLFPFAAALKAEHYAPIDIGIVGLLVVAFLTALTALGFLTRLPLPRKNGQTKTDLTANFLAGARLTALVAVTITLTKGIGRSAVSARVDDLLGIRLGERLQAAIGTAAIRDTLLVMLLGFVISAFARWALPLAANSRPLIFMKTLQEAPNA